MLNAVVSWEYKGKKYHITQRDDKYYTLFRNDKEVCSSKELDDLTAWCPNNPLTINPNSAIIK